MKRILSLITLFIVYMTASAQWSDNANQNNLISKQGEFGLSLTKTVKTSDDKMFVSYTADGLNFHTKLQLLDKDGNPLWENGGIYVSQHPSATWTTDYTLGITPDDCAIVTMSDSRTDPDNNIFQPFIYKINKAGEFLWGIDGIKLPYEGTRGYRPRFCVTNAGSVIVGWTDSDNSCVRFVKISPEGELVWGDYITIENASTVNMVPSGEDGFIITYYIVTGGNSANFYAEKYNSNGEAVWDSPVVIDNSGGVSSYNEPFVQADGEGGVVTLYGMGVSNSEIYVMLQRVDAEGDLVMGLTGVKVSNIYCVHSSGQFDVDTERGEIFVQEIAYRAGDNEGRHLRINKFDMFGEPFWGEEGIALTENQFWGYMTFGIKKIGDGGAMAIYTSDLSAVTGKIMAAKIENDGSARWKNVPVCDVVSGKSRVVSSPVFNNQICVFWEDNRNLEEETISGYGQIFGQNIGLDGKLGVVLTGIDNINTFEKSVSVFPNPSKGLVKIDLPYTENSVRIMVYDYSGKIVTDIYTSDGSLDLSSQKDGVYFIRCINEEINTISKIIIKH